jgi:hypothetical protein
MVHRAKTDQHDLFYGPSYPVQLTDYDISLLFCLYTRNQPATCNITNHVICLVVRSGLFKLPQACKTLIVSLVFCSPLPYKNVLYYYQCAVCALQYRKEN